MHQTLETIVLSLKESFIMALVALRANKLRSALTLLGIAVGVFSIIGVMTAMGVLINSIERGASELGANTFQVQRNSNFHSGDPKERAKMRNRKNITYAQGLAVKEKATFAEAVGIEAWQFGKIVKGDNGLKTNPEIQIAGEDVEGITTNNWIVQDGRMFTHDEYGAGKHVCVVALGVVDKLFPRTDPIGRSVEIDGVSFTIIGTFERKGQMLGGSNDRFIVIPLTAFLRMYGQNNRSLHIMVTSSPRASFEDCTEQVRGILRSARRVPPGADDDFYIFSNESVINQFNEMTKYVRLGIMLVSAISLIAAGVGIMNIMLVSVTERTREIGIRKAVGARKKNILAQFILEAVLLSEMGGLIGIAIGILAGNVIALVLDVPPVFPFDWAVIGFVTCSIVGIIFGVYPAWKASNLDPIESLRYE